MMKKKTMKEISYLMTEITTEDDPLMKELACDDRIGVQQILARWRKQQLKNQQLEQQFEEMMYFENKARERGYIEIAGLDEVGRGPLAGPVVAACVIVPEDFMLLGLTDSKKLSAKDRIFYYDEIIKGACAVGIGEATAKEIDEINILQASKKAMLRAIKHLNDVTPDYLLVDAMELPIHIPQQGLIKGDSRSISIAASSVIAKVTRDRYMEKLHNQFPAYQFDKHMGYGTKIHLKAIEKHGVLDEHRKSFAPIKAYL